MNGFDAATNVTQLVPKITAAGLGFVGRYYGGNAAKDLTLPEAQALTKATLGIIVYYEAQGDRIGSFTPAMGTADARVALRQATAVGQPHGTPIFFAADLDPSPAEETSAILPYFKAVKALLGGTYDVGVYGSGLTCETVTGAGIARFAVLGAIGWRDGHAFLPRANVVQKPPSDPWHLGFEVDPLIAQTPEFGAWNLNGPISVPPTAQIVAQLGSHGDVVRAIQRALGVAVDGIYGPVTLRAVNAFKASHGLEVDATGIVDAKVMAALGLSV